MPTAAAVGRFAPSPSGPLHFGSLLAAVGSYLYSKQRAGKWLLRIEDIDTPRVRPGADSSIKQTLEQHGLLWDGEILYQSQRTERYQQVFNQLRQQDLLYGCQCSRKQITAAGGLYPGTCSTLNLGSKNRSVTTLSWRLRASGVSSRFVDCLLGPQQIAPELAAEDYILLRRDGLFSYQLAVVVDDMDQGITEVIRGADLLSMTSRQQHLFQLLGAKPPVYGHLPLAVTAPGHKLSKQNHATALANWPASYTMAKALTILGLQLPIELQQAPASEQLTYALANWQPAAIPAAQEVLTSEFG
ncbi:tRNA glutamyl-Q(34) synthetase GluQRS [Arsukibacterium indicum]|uniref:Glutamyl-Q tRNA(Asp) synthetase n=1 Tax=Arsukibacterium indicum TaxID=2848612 RepID=A0ABS6MPC2_9GAMM|nr:tRNA glutamyl-Q(34) synthetase GluQRS [Arsukibacterium indicum]MBV2130692.1 tRNA glutamyl-Q(34) synthetase GluQRS [Arsukibacterium indicum]